MAGRSPKHAERLLEAVDALLAWCREHRQPYRVVLAEIIWRFLTIQGVRKPPDNSG